MFLSFKAKLSRSLICYFQQWRLKSIVVFSDPAKAGEGKGFGWMPIPCTDDYANFCVHGQCEFNYGIASCRWASGIWLHGSFRCSLKKRTFVGKWVSDAFLFFHRCDSGYTGTQCDEIADFNILYVVPSGQKLHYVLIAAIIGAVQIAIIVAVVMCITR